MSETPQETLEKWLDSGSWIGSDRHSIREAIRAVLADDRAFRLALFFMCPHDMKYGDDGEMQCRGADLKRLPVEDVVQHVVGALREWRERAEAERDALRSRVEAVLALKPMESDGSFAAGSAWMLKEVHRILNGKE